MKLGLTMSAQEAAEVWGCSQWSIYQMVGAGTCPVEPLHLGRKLRWPTAEVLASVGLTYDPATGVAQVRSKDDESPAVGANLRALPLTEGAAR